MTLVEKIKQLLWDEPLQQKTIAIDMVLIQNISNEVESDIKESSVEILQKLSVLTGLWIDKILNIENKKKHTPLNIKNKSLSNYIKLIKQTEEEDKNVIFKMLDTVLTKKEFQDFFYGTKFTNFKIK